MLGSAVQNIITLSDNIFLYHSEAADFGAIAIVGVFYLTIAAIGFGFSKGGQIIIARRVGEGQPEQAGRTFYAMLYFELALAVVMFLFMQFGSPYFFAAFVDSEVYYTKCLEYLDYRSYGVFFSYAGVAIVALYTGIARPMFIFVDTMILAIVNIALNYALIFGHFGLPKMGIAGAGLASTVAEIVAFIVFVVYILFDKKIRDYRLFFLPKIDIPLISTQLRLATPIVAQAVVGLGSWFVFIILIENMGDRALDITNMVRIVYLVLSIPSWGFATGINTLVSNFIGQGRRDVVLPIIWKTAKLCWFVTMLVTLPVILAPKYTLYPLFGSEDMSLIVEAQPIFYVLIVILTLFSIGTVYFNGLAGTGATYYGLQVQIICAVAYLGYTLLVIKGFRGDLALAWASEILYWIIMMSFVIPYLKAKKWYGLRV